MRPCTVPTCEKPHKARGFCGTHYERLRTGGDPFTDPPTTWQRFLSYTQDDPSTGCVEWIDRKTPNGYGTFTAAGTTGMAHRYAYESLVGLIPADLTVDHLCRNRACVNVDHMELVPLGENIRRGDSPTAINARKDQCKWGHPFTEENTYHRPSGGRRCKTCRTELRRKTAASKRAAA